MILVADRPCKESVRACRAGFMALVTLDPMRLTRDAGTVNQEVIQHLVALMGAKARITLEIEVDIPDGVPDSVVRVVTENSRTLKFGSHEFEDE